MSWFNKSSNISDLETDEIQAYLNGLCYKIIARGFALSGEMDDYGELITELTRRGVKPIQTLIPVEKSNNGR